MPVDLVVVLELLTFFPPGGLMIWAVDQDDFGGDVGSVQVIVQKYTYDCRPFLVYSASHQVS